MVDQAFTIAWYGARKYDEDATKRSLMHKLTHRAIAFICTAALSVGLIGACTLREEGQEMTHCDGDIIALEPAIRYQLIEGFSQLRITGTNADTIDGMPQAMITVSWSAGINVPEGLYQQLKLGESATLEKVGTFTLIGMEPPAHGKRWPTPVVCFEQDPQLMDTARQYAADNNLYFRPDDEEARQS